MSSGGAREKREISPRAKIRDWHYRGTVKNEVEGNCEWLYGASRLKTVSERGGKGETIGL